MTDDNTKNTINQLSRKIETKEIPRSFSSNLIFSRKNILYVEEEFFADKEESALDLIFIPKEDENETPKEETICEKNNEKTEDKKEEIKVEINDEKEKNEVIEKNVNNIKVEKNLNSIKIVNNINIKNNDAKNTKKRIDDVYSQNYSRKDFKDKPPNISSLYLHDYDYENKNIFSYSNETNGNINEEKKVPNIFYNHLLTNKTNGKINITTSMNQRHLEKLVTFVYYMP